MKNESERRREEKEKREKENNVASIDGDLMPSKNGNFAMSIDLLLVLR